MDWLIVILYTKGSWGKGGGKEIDKSIKFISHHFELQLDVAFARSNCLVYTKNYENIPKRRQIFGGELVNT